MKENKVEVLPFDFERARELEKYYPGKYLVTEEGYPVRVICWDKKGSEPCIVALVSGPDGYEDFLITNTNGESGLPGGRNSIYIRKAL